MLKSAQITTKVLSRTGGRFPVLAALHRGVPLVRCARPAHTARRSPEDERLLAAVLGTRRRGFLIDLGPGRQEDPGCSSQ